MRSKSTSEVGVADPHESSSEERSQTVVHGNTDGRDFTTDKCLENTTSEAFMGRCVRDPCVSRDGVGSRR